jgi:hypothetical protein
MRSRNSNRRGYSRNDKGRIQNFLHSQFLHSLVQKNGSPPFRRTTWP